MNIKKPAHLLDFWQGIHGELDTKWHKEFIKDKFVKEILSHPTDNINVASPRDEGKGKGSFFHDPHTVKDHLQSLLA